MHKAFPSQRGCHPSCWRLRKAMGRIVVMEDAMTDHLAAEAFGPLGDRPIMWVDCAAASAEGMARRYRQDTRAIVVGVDLAGACPSLDPAFFDMLLTTVVAPSSPWVGVAARRMDDRRKAIEARLADPSFLPPYNKPDPAVFNVDVYNMGVFRYESLYIGMPAMYHATSPPPSRVNTEGFHLVHLASSRDLKNWTRHGDRKPFIGSSRVGSGAYDLTQILGPSDAVRRGDELWFYYTGLKYRGGWVLEGGKYIPGPGFKPDRDSGAICLAVLRRDGFVSLDACEQEGTVLTEPFKLSGSTLFVNVDAVKGELRVEFLNGDGNVVAKSKPLTGDVLREPVTWAEGDIADLKGRTASLRFTLRNGQFYSYWLE